MKKTWIIVLTVLGTIIITEILYSMMSSAGKKQGKNTLNPSVSPQLTPEHMIPTPVTSMMDIAIIYQQKNDSTDRSVFYIYKNRNRKDKGFEGIGLYGFSQMPFMIGQLEKKEQIQGTNDWYFYLKDPTNNTEVGKLRILLTPSVYYPLPDKVTLMATENINKPGIVERKNEDKSKSGVTLADLNSFVPNQDAVVALILNNSKGEMIKDAQGAYIVQILSNRRLQ